MTEISISDVTQQTGLRPSTLRYYEEIGLVCSLRRVGNRRQYDEGVLQRLALIQTGQQAGFTLAELGMLLNNISNAGSGDMDWHELVNRKLKEMEVKLRHIESMKNLLEDIRDCDDETLAECIVLTGQRHSMGQP